MIKAIIFDCFGVLAEDGWTPFKRKYIGANQELARDVADLGKANDAGMLGFEEMIAGVSALIGVNPQILRDAVNKKVPNEELFMFIEQELKSRYKIGLLSNASYDVVHELFTPEQTSQFDAAVISYDTGLTKPDVRMFERIASNLAVEPEECLFIDDVERYCVAAEEAGMQSLWYQDLEQAITALREVMAQ